MRKFILVLFAIVNTNLYSQHFDLNGDKDSQLIAFNSYEDYKNNAGKTYDKVTSLIYGSILKIDVTSDGVKTRLKCNNFWGFTYKKALFRNNLEDGKPLAVKYNGRIIYYEDAISTSYSKGYYYLSKSLDSPICSMATKGKKKNQKRIEEFKALYPEFKEIFACLETMYNYRQHMYCIRKYEGVIIQ